MYSINYVRLKTFGSFIERQTANKRQQQRLVGK